MPVTSAQQTGTIEGAKWSDLDADGVKALSTMASLPEMRASLLGLLQAPATKLARLLGTPATQLAQVLKAHQDKIQEK